MSTSNSPARVAIVTGGSGGIGRASAEHLARDEYAVLVAYAGSKDRADAAVAQINDAGGQAIAVRVDVGDPESVEALFDEAEERYGGVDAVVHAAGRMLPPTPLNELELDALDALHRVNIRGTFVVNQQAARRLRPGGTIVNFSSSVVQIARPGYSAYAASKGAVEGLTLTLAHEFRGRDITINAISPGPTATPLFLEGKDQQLLDQIAAEPPLQRLGTPEDAAELVAFLASPAGRWINGQVIRSNGGIV